MKRLFSVRWRRILALALVGILVISAALSGTMAWTDFSQHRTNVAEGSGPPKLSNALLQKYEAGTTTPVPGTEFGLYRVGPDGTATLVRYFITGADGQILASDLEPGDYYWQETRPAPGYLPELVDGQPKQYPFSVPGEDDDPVRVVAYNTRSQGHLIVKKTVTGEGGDLTREFDFTAVIGGVTHTLKLKHGQQKIFENLPVGTSYTVTEAPVTGYVTTSENHAGTVPTGGVTASFVNAYSPIPPEYGSLTVTKTVTGDGANLNLEFDFIATINGVSHSFKLKHGQSKLFENIPLGTDYTVTETEIEDYTANHLSYTGKITRAGQTVTLPFVNHYDGDNPPDLPGKLEISKTVAGTNPDLDKAFTFTVSFEGEGAPENPPPFTLKHGEKKTFEDIPRGVRYTVTEAPETGYLADFTTATGTIAAGQTASVGFINRTPVLPRDFRITVIKRVLGTPPDGDSDKLFSFTLTINGTPHNFSLKAGETSAPYTVLTGDVYALTEQDSAGYTRGMVGNGFGVVGNEDIIIVQTNIYDGPEYIDIEGEKTWQAPAGTERPDSVTILLKNGSVTVRTTTTDSSKNWRYEFKNLPKHDALGNVIVYTVEEIRIPGWRPVVTGYDIKNYLQTPLEDTAIEVEKAITGVPPQAAEFKFILTAVNGAPVPVSNEVSITGAGKASFGKITYTAPGVFTYTITEIDGKLAGWSYDASVYTLTVTVTENADGQLTVSKALTKAGQPAEKALFTNRYDESGETISVRVTKVWQGDGTHPQSVQVQLYKDGTLHDTATLSSANSWTRTWSGLEKGHVWTVDEVNVPEGYTKTISGDAVNGFTITNTKGSVPETGSLTVTKTVTGQGADLNKEFEFTAVIGGVTHTFKLKHGQSKTFGSIPLGTSYTVTETEAADYISAMRQYSGTIHAAGVTVSLPFVNHFGSTPDLPGSLEISKTVVGTSADNDKAFTFTIAFEGTGAPASPQTFTLKDGEKKTFAELPQGLRYTVTEAASEGYLPDFTTASGVIAGDRISTVGFTNRVPGIIEEKTSVKVTKIWKGEDANRPASIAVQLYKDKAASGVPVLLSEANNWTYTWTGLEKGPAWTADEVNVPAGYIGAVTGDAANGFVITNTKTETPPPGEDEITLTGKKTWNHGANSESKRPDGITVIIKADGVIVAQRRVTAAENWSWSIKLPKNYQGKEIKYTVDEASVENYVKTIDGFNLINTYTPGGGPGKPGEPSKPQTDDESNLALWLILLALSLGGLVVLIVISIVRRKKRREREAEIWSSGLL